MVRPPCLIAAYAHVHTATCTREKKPKTNKQKKTGKIASMSLVSNPERGSAGCFPSRTHTFHLPLSLFFLTCLLLSDDSGAKFWPNNIVTLLSQMCAAGGEETLCTGGARNRCTMHTYALMMSTEWTQLLKV